MNNSIKVPRIYHHWLTWECISAGMYSNESTKQYDYDYYTAYAEFLKNSKIFQTGLTQVLHDWPISCEQFLSNGSINRIAWLGQAAMCITTNIPRRYRAGFKLLTTKEQQQANALANATLDVWLAQYIKKSHTKTVYKSFQNKGTLKKNIHNYLGIWKQRGYPIDISDEVPTQLMQDNLAPSYKQIVMAILNNDHHLHSLGYPPVPSKWYGILKTYELSK